VRLEIVSTPTVVFSATTNSDGRIANWTSPTERSSIESLIADRGETSTWKLVFDTGAYYGMDKTFFPKVELTFLAKPGEHFHVPLLLGPYSYTTYRGS
jgi:5-hydroxyisourate hydrolase